MRFVRVVVGGAMVLAVGTAFGSTAARADSIDGEWCWAASNLHIQGPSIRTPGGSRIQGSYDRHNFSYVVPAPEPGAGSEVIMRLLNEENVNLVRKSGAVESVPEIWKRCRPTS